MVRPRLAQAPHTENKLTEFGNGVAASENPSHHSANMNEVVPITAIVAAYMRIPQTLDTIERLQTCRPAPAEIVVHVDGNQVDCAEAVRQRFPSVRVHVSSGNIGPGGARNLMIQSAQYEWVASFDDDSYPLDSDFFARACTLVARLPSVAVVTTAVFHRGEVTLKAERTKRRVATFLGGGCVYRRSAFLSTAGYVPLPMAYGMEEVDLSLRLQDSGWQIMHTSWLRVFHDNDLSHHANPEITAASIANIALLTYLRYPLRYWALGAGQVLNRVQWLVRVGRSRGVLAGLLAIPLHLWRNRQYRATVKASTLRESRKLRHCNEQMSI